MTRLSEAWRAVHRALTRLRDTLTILAGRPGGRERKERP